MKNFIKLGIYISIVTLSLTCFIGCKNNDIASETPTNEIEIKPTATDTPSETELPPVATQHDTIVTDEDTKSNNKKNDHTADIDDTQDNTQNDNQDDIQDNKYDVVFDNYLNTAEYKVEIDGMYEFECDPSDNKAYWDIYVLDEPFEDALKYLSSAYSPILKATDESQKIKLKKGQYVYCVCSENAFTTDGTSTNFKCPLTIELDD